METAMNNKKLPLPLLILGWIAIIAVPFAFFIFGWRDIQLSCRRPGPGAPPTCQVSETLAMGLYTRQVTVEQAIGVGFQIRAAGSGARAGGGSLPASTVVLATPSGKVPISRVSSNVDGDAKAELIGKMQEFLNNPNTLAFQHHAKMHSIFGYLGVIGVAGLAFLLLAVFWYQVRKWPGWGKSPEKG